MVVGLVGVRSVAVDARGGLVVAIGLGQSSTCGGIPAAGHGYWVCQRLDVYVCLRWGVQQASLPVCRWCCSVVVHCTRRYRLLDLTWQMGLCSALHHFSLVPVHMAVQEGARWGDGPMVTVTVSHLWPDWYASYLVSTCRGVCLFCYCCPRASCLLLLLPCRSVREQRLADCCYFWCRSSICWCISTAGSHHQETEGHPLALCISCAGRWQTAGRGSCQVFADEGGVVACGPVWIGEWWAGTSNLGSLVQLHQLLPCVDLCSLWRLGGAAVSLCSTAATWSPEHIGYHCQTQPAAVAKRLRLVAQAAAAVATRGTSQVPFTTVRCRDCCLLAA